MERVSNLVFSKDILKFSRNILKKYLMTSSTARSAEVLEKLKKNEYYEKYADKIAKLQQTSPEEFLSRAEKYEEKIIKKSIKSLKDNQYSQLLNPKKTVSSPIESIEQQELDKIMKIDLIKDKSTEEIKEIWKQYHLQKNYIAAIVPSNDFDELIRNSIIFRTFLYPLPRSQGYEFVMGQFDSRNSIHFTPLLFYQVHKENAPECLTITHYTELKESKGIVLMRGEYDQKIIDLKEAQCLANQLQLYYIRPSEEKLKIMKTFTKNPDQFKHMDLVKQIESLSL